MEKKKNIISFSGLDHYGIRMEINRWKNRFRENQDGLNIDIFRIEEIKDWQQIEGEMLTMGLFADKRLFCISGGEGKKSDTTYKKEAKAPSKKDLKGAEAEERLIAICESLPNDHFIIFSDLGLSQKKSPLLAWIEKNADTKIYNDVWNIQTWASRFLGIDTVHIQSVLDTYKKSESGRESVRESISESIGNSLEKLELLSISRKLTSEDVRASILTEASGKIFDFSDSVMRGDTLGTLKLFHQIIESTNTHAFVPLVTGILRGNIYTKALKYAGKTEGEITKLISVNPYVLQKAYRSSISYEKLRDFYHKMISINTAYRSGKGLKDAELGRILAIELAIMGLKK